MNKSIVQFVENLGKYEQVNVFNPYGELDPINDKKDGSSIRRKNLSNYLSAVKTMELDTLWIGESLGIRGGRRTGLPFSDDLTIKLIGKIYGIKKLKNATQNAITENPAQIIIKILKKLSDQNLPILWNIFPFHPYEDNNGKLKSRGLNAYDRSTTERYLIIFLELFDIHKIYAIGKQAESVLTKLAYDVTYIRHPSHGGSNLFQSQMNEIYF